MDSYGIKRCVDNLGRITIPKPFRDAIGIDCGDKVEICHVDDGILIKAVSVDED